MKHLFFYISSIFLVANLLTPLSSCAAMTRVETITNVGKSLLMPWKSTRAFDNKVNSFTTGLAFVAYGCEWLQPLQPQGTKKEKKKYREALKDPGMRHWVVLYNVIWYTKKGVACNELYRLGSRFHWESHNPLEYVVSLLKIITIFGDRLIDPEQLEKASKKLWGKQAEQPRDNGNNSPKG